MVLIKRHTNHRNDVIDGSLITQRPCPFFAHGKNGATFAELKIGHENCKHNGCILKLENEDTININFEVFSTDERGNIISSIHFINKIIYVLITAARALLANPKVSSQAKSLSWALIYDVLSHFQPIW